MLAAQGQLIPSRRSEDGLFFAASMNDFAKAEASRLDRHKLGLNHKGNAPPLLTPSSFGAAGRNSGGEAIFVELLIAAAALRVW